MAQTQGSALGFYGVVCKSKATIAISPEENTVLRISSASLADKSKEATLAVKSGGNTFNVCHLNAANPNTALDLFFVASNEASFTVAGAGDVHLTGYTTLLELGEDGSDNGDVAMAKAFANGDSEDSGDDESFQMNGDEESDEEEDDEENDGPEITEVKSDDEEDSAEENLAASKSLKSKAEAAAAAAPPAKQVKTESKAAPAPTPKKAEAKAAAATESKAAPAPTPKKAEAKAAAAAPKAAAGKPEANQAKKAKEENKEVKKDQKPAAAAKPQSAKEGTKDAGLKCPDCSKTNFASAEAVKQHAAAKHNKKN